MKSTHHWLLVFTLACIPLLARAEQSRVEIDWGRSEAASAPAGEREARLGIALSSWAPPAGWGSSDGSSGYERGAIPSFSIWGAMHARHFEMGELRGFAGVRYGSWARVWSLSDATGSWDLRQEAHVVGARVGAEFAARIGGGSVSRWIRPVANVFAEPTVGLFPRSVAGAGQSVGGILFGASLFLESELGGLLPLRTALLAGAEWRGGVLGGTGLWSAPALFGGLSMAL